MKVLIIEDDFELRSLIAFVIRQSGYLALEASSGEQGLEFASREQPDLVILDINLPGMDGFETCRILRKENQVVPVLILTVRGDEEDEVKGLDSGADDYLVKPFSPKTLLARVRALFRRSSSEQTPHRLVVGDLELCHATQSLTISGHLTFRLTALEFRLLQLLVAHDGKPVLTSRILIHVWGVEGAWERQRLKQLVHRLRQKIEKNPNQPQRLVTLQGLGYALNKNAQA